MPNTRPRRGRAFAIGFALLLLGGCTGEIVGTVTTDYGFAIASTERMESGDVESLLVSRDGEDLLGEMRWSAETGQTSATVRDAPVAFTGVMEIDDASLELVNELLHALWENDVVGEAGAVCVGNELAICCRDGSWRCQAH